MRKITTLKPVKLFFNMLKSDYQKSRKICNFPYVLQNSIQMHILHIFKCDMIPIAYIAINMLLFYCRNRK